MAQTTDLPTQEDFFAPWPDNWVTDQSMGSFDSQPGPGLLAEATPMLSNTPDITPTNDVRSLYIMICCRLDKIENSLARVEGDFARTQENVEKTVQVGNSCKDMVAGLKKSLGLFSKALFAYLRGDQAVDANILRSD